MNEYLSPRQFAKRYGLGEATVYRYLHRGRLVGVQPAGKRGRWLIPHDAFQRLLEEAPREVAGDTVTEIGPAKKRSGPRPK